MRRAFQTDPKHMGLLDYVLVGTMISLALYSTTQAVNAGAWGILFVGMGIAGTAFSFWMSRTAANTKLVDLDGYFYTTLAFIAFFTNPNFLDDTSPQLVMPRFLVWAISIGTFAMWRDRTVLFQAVPSIALFGLVGVYDTFSGAVFCFYIFLLCLATLLGRYHARTMAWQAEASGFSRLDTLRDSVWRWMAGPEWALGSALVVVLLSVLGAPVVQQSVAGVAGRVKYAPPVRAAVRNNTAADALLSSAGTSLPIGRGPRNLSDKVLLWAATSYPRYLKTGTYDTYTRNAWKASAGTTPSPTLAEISRDEIKNPSKTDFSIELSTDAGNPIPVPGAYADSLSSAALANNVSRPSSFARLPTAAPGQDAQITTYADGTFGFKSPPPHGIVSGVAWDMPHQFIPSNAVHDLPGRFENMLSTDGVPPKVQELAASATAGAKDDWDRVIRIVREIDSRVKYNLNAEATPAEEDPVENFLFTSHEGYCDLFASSTVLMCRSVGIPARLVAGFYPVNAEKDSQGRYILHESDSHAWAEVYMEGAGWVTVDATEQATAVPGGERGDTNVSAVWQKWWFKFLLMPLAALLVIAVLVGIKKGIMGLKRTPPGPRQKIDRLYVRFERLVNRVYGRPRRPWQTSAEYIENATPTLGAAYEIARQVNALFESALYAPPEDEATQLAKLGSEVDRFAVEVKKLPSAKRR